MTMLLAEHKQQVTEPPSVQFTLDNLHQRQRCIMDKDQVTRRVIQYLSEKLKGSKEPSLTTAEYEVVGSSAENLVTCRADDWDILLILGAPYTPAYFKSSYDAHGRHYLKWNGAKWKGLRPRFVDINNQLCPVPLRTAINTCVKSALEGANISGMTVKKVLVWKQAVRTIIKDSVNSSKFTVDIIPQIQGDKWRKVEGVAAFNSLHPEIQSAITNLEATGKSAILFSLFAAPATAPILFTTSYALLEREFFSKNGNLRSILLLAKMILTGHRWKDKYGLKSAHLKRIVLANISTLSHHSPYSGMHLLLSLVVRQLREGSLDGFLDLHSDLLWHKTEEECELLAQAVADVLTTLDPAFFPNYL